MTISKFFKISATLKYYKYKLLKILGNRTFLVDCDDPKETYGNPKKGCDPQFKNCCIKIFLGNHQTFFKLQKITKNFGCGNLLPKKIRYSDKRN